MSSEKSPASYWYQEALGPIAKKLDDPGLRKKLSEALALLDFNSTLNRSCEIPEILDLVLFVTMGETRASWAGVMLEEGDALKSVARRGRSDEKWEALLFPCPPEDLATAGVGDAEVPPWSLEVLTATGASVLIPLTQSGRHVGILLVGDRGEPYFEDERRFTETLAISAAAAIDNQRTRDELKRLNRRLSLHVYQLDSLFDITRELNRSPDVGRVREVLLTNAMGHVLTTRAVMLEAGAVVAERGVRLSLEDRALVERCGEALAALPEDRNVSEIEDGEMRALLSGLSIDTVVPLRSGESSHGALLLGARASGKSLAEEDRDFLRSLAAQAAAALDNLRLTREWVEKQKIEKEMALAREIQRGLLPESDPEIDGWDIAGINIPCLTVGGDYFDYVPRGEDKHWLVIADVSGKGTGAALLMASVQAALHALAGIGDISLEALTERLNEIVYTSTEVNRYVTAFFSSLAADTGEMTYVNAGHCYPIVFRASGDVERLVDGSPVIGLLPDIDLRPGTTKLALGDVLLLYTDGLSETCSPEGEEFEDERVLELLRASRGLPSREIMARLLSGVRVFAAEAGLADDLTLMVVQKK